MMSISHLLEQFDETSIAFLATPDSSTTDQELDVFERGYKAGWDDSTNAQTKAGTALEEDFCENVRELSFTYHEAREAVLDSMAPFFRSFTQAALPQLTRVALVDAISQKIETQARASESTAMHLKCHPAQRRFLEEAVLSQDNLQVTVVEDDSFSDGQVCLRLEDSEVEFDQATFQRSVTDLVNAQFSAQSRTV